MKNKLSRKKARHALSVPVPAVRDDLKTPAADSATFIAVWRKVTRFMKNKLSRKKARHALSAPVPAVRDDLKTPAADSTTFVAVWRVEANQTISFDLSGDCTIDWGDGSPLTRAQSLPEGHATHTYKIAGDFAIKISNEITRFVSMPSDGVKLLEVKQWGALVPTCLG